MTQTFDRILEELAAGEMTVIERKVFEALRTHPAGLNRAQLVAIAFGEMVRAGSPQNNSTKDRKVRLAIASLRERMVPIVSSSGAAGYRLDTSEKARRKMLADLISRRDSLTDLISRTAKFYHMPEMVPASETAQQGLLL